MKKIYHNLVSMIAAAAVAAAAVSCAADDELTPSPSAEEDAGFSVSLTVAAEEGTRTTMNTLNEHILTWTNTGEHTRMGLCVSRVGVLGGESYYCLRGSGCTQMSDDKRSATFSFTSQNEIVSLGRAFYPYVYETYGETERMGSLVTFTIPVEQKQNSAVEAGKAGVSNGYDILPMIGESLSGAAGAVFEGKDATVKTKMHILSSIISFFVYDSIGQYAGETVEKITFQAESGGNVAGATEIDLSQLGADEIPALTGKQRTASVTLNSYSKLALGGVTSKDTSKPIYLSVIPGDYSGKILVKTDVAIYAFPFSVAKHFGRAEVKDMLLNLSNENVQRTLLAGMETPDITVTNLARSYVSDTQTATITVQKLNSATVGFYALFEGQGTVERLTATDVISRGDVYQFGQADNELFTLQADGTVNYKKVVEKGAGETFAFAVVPFDQFGNTGDVKGDKGFNITSTKSEYTNLELVEDESGSDWGDWWY